MRLAPGPGSTGTAAQDSEEEKELHQVCTEKLSCVKDFILTLEIVSVNVMVILSVSTAGLFLQLPSPSSTTYP